MWASLWLCTQFAIRMTYDRKIQEHWARKSAHTHTPRWVCTIWCCELWSMRMLSEWWINFHGWWNLLILFSANFYVSFHAAIPYHAIDFARRQSKEGGRSNRMLLETPSKSINARPCTTCRWQHLETKGNQSIFDRFVQSFICERCLTCLDCFLGCKHSS